MRIKAFVILSFVCCLAYSADTTATLSGATRSTQFVTAVDHTKLENGNVSVIAGQDGTVSLIKPGTTTKTIVVSAVGYAGVTYHMEFTSQNSAAELASGEIESISGTLTITISQGNDETFSGTWTQIEAGVPVYAQDGIGWRFAFYSDYCEIFNSQSGCEATYTTGTITVPTTITEIIATVEQLSTVATTGSYNDLLNKPTNISSFSNDANYTSGQVATNIARQIIRDAVSQVNVNLQSADDTRAALTNLITILKNL